MKKVFAVAAALTLSMGADAAYRDNGGISWPTLFGADKTKCEHAKDERRPVAHKPYVVASFDSVQFAYKSTSVTGSQADLNAAKKVIKAEPNAKFAVVGYTDSRGADAYNKALSEQRAAAVRDWLVANGVDAGRLTTVGMGESNPIADNATAEGRAQNRRVELHRAK